MKRRHWMLSGAIFSNVVLVVICLIVLYNYPHNLLVWVGVSLVVALWDYKGGFRFLSPRRAAHFLRRMKEEGM